MRARTSATGIGQALIRLLAILFVTVAPAATSQATGELTPPDVVVLTPNALVQGITLRDGWRFGAGDDPRWADPTFDDRDWPLVDSTGAGLGSRFRGAGWLRRRLRGAHSLEQTIVGIRVVQTGASEIYLDGRRVATLGVVSADPEREVAWDPPYPLAIAVEPGREHLLAVRFSLAHGHQLTNGFRGIRLRLGELDGMLHASTSTLRRLVPFMAAAAGLAGALGLVHGLLFLLDRRAREHAYFAVFAVVLSLDVLCDMMSNLTADFAAQLLWLRIGVPFLVAMLLAGIQLELVLFQRRRGRYFWILTAAGTGVVAWVWWIPGLRDITVLVVFMILAVAEMLRLAVAEIFQRRPDSGVVAAGLAILALSFANYFAGYFGLPLVRSGISLIVGWGAAVVSLSLFIARRASRTNRELRQRLDEIDELTQRTIEQERRVAHERAERRVLEADHARKTRELQEARELQLAMLPRHRPRLAAVDVAFRMRTATEVGGDYYDYVADGSERCTIAVGDATGHGTHAGMVVAVAKSLFTSMAPTSDPVQILREISERLAGLRRRGAAMALVILRIDDRRLHVVGTAMPPLLVGRGATRAVEEVSLSAPPLGTGLGGDFPEAVLDLAPGDTVLVSTDGLAEVLDPDGEPWGYDRLAEVYGRIAQGDPEETLDGLLEAAESYAGGRDLPDDVTLVVIRAREPHAPRQRHVR